MGNSIENIFTDVGVERIDHRVFYYNGNNYDE